MCGLTFSLTLEKSQAQCVDHTSLINSFHDANITRGPNAQGVFARRVQTPAGYALITLGASVLGLRGPTTVAQPLVGRKGVLGWNGQVFNGLDMTINDNDTQKLFNRLERGDHPDDVFAEIEGPYAFIYYSFLNEEIYFATDPLSRRSLLIHLPETGSPCQSFLLSSSRSTYARLQDIVMRNLEGGECGMIQLSRLVLSSDGTLDLSTALKMVSRASKSNQNSGLWTRIAPINTSLPTSRLESRESECRLFIDSLMASVRRQVENIPAARSGLARVAILFSGGVDCSLLACLVHRCLPIEEPIELVNVAFESRMEVAARSIQSTPSPLSSYNVPDRLSGHESVKELREACPGREFRFIEIDVNVTESCAHRQAIIDLMYPSKTEMDLSLAFPLYFASKGQGIIIGPNGREPYSVSAKVYISGLGADEQLGGYTRHRRAFERDGWQGLVNEVQLDIDRLPMRNLSRDDRMISSHARDARYPYLDLSFVDHVSALPIWVKCDPTLDVGWGDKQLLRLAAERCSLTLSSKRVKRAMQFGTRSAKIDRAPNVKKGFRAGENIVSASE